MADGISAVSLHRQVINNGIVFYEEVLQIPVQFWYFEMIQMEI